MAAGRLRRPGLPRRGRQPLPSGGGQIFDLVLWALHGRDETVERLLRSLEARIETGGIFQRRAGLRHETEAVKGDAEQFVDERPMRIEPDRGDGEVMAPLPVASGDVAAGESIEDPGIVRRLGGKRLKERLSRRPVAEKDEHVGLLAAAVRVGRDLRRRLIEEGPGLFRPAEENLEFGGPQQRDRIGAIARMDGGIGRVERLFEQAEPLPTVGQEKVGPLDVREEAGLHLEHWKRRAIVSLGHERPREDRECLDQRSPAGNWPPVGGTDSVSTADRLLVSSGL